MSTPFNPEGFVFLAKRVLSVADVDLEARARGSVGRAYYGLFLATREAVMQAAGRAPDDSIKHGALTSALFSASGETDGDKFVALAKTLQDLYEYRRAADYDTLPAPKYRTSFGKVGPMRSLAESAHDAIRRIPKLDFSPVKNWL